MSLSLIVSLLRINHIGLYWEAWARMRQNYVSHHIFSILSASSWYTHSPQNMLPRVLPFFFNVSSSFSLKFTHIDDSLLVAILHPGDIWQYLKPFLIVMTGVGDLLRHLVVEVNDVDKHPTMLRTAPYNFLIPNVNSARSWNCDIHTPHCIWPKGLNSFDLVLIPHLCLQPEPFHLMPFWHFKSNPSSHVTTGQFKCPTFYVNSIFSVHSSARGWGSSLTSISNIFLNSLIDRLALLMEGLHEELFVKEVEWSGSLRFKR